MVDDWRKKSTPDARCTTRLVSDEPSERDDLGPHARIAAAIVGMIEQEAGGRTVGLAGSYGSGKSTVVNLIARQLDDMPTKKDRFVWVFDAWAHDGDPLRRTFLEDLTAALLERGWVPAAHEKQWRKRLQRLRRRFKRVATETHPRPSWPGVAMALAVLLAPLAAVVLTAGLRHSQVAFGVPSTPSGWAATLLIVPFLIALGVLAVGVFKARGFNDGALDFVGRVVVQKEGTSQTSNTYETGEPTSLEFERYFSKLMGDISKEGRKLVLVVDNLDRVDPDHALRIWSTLRTFLDHGAKARCSSWLRQLWVVIPFSNALHRIWDKEEGGQLAASAIDKSIQVRFDVPAPMLHDWQGFLHSVLSQALPDHDHADLPGISRLFAVCRSASDGAPTPRELVAFVNTLGALHRQHGHDVPLIVQAYFALTSQNRSYPRREDGDQPKGRHGNMAAALVAGDWPEPHVRRLLGDSAADELAALLFGKDVESARHLLLGGTIAECLLRGDGQRLAQIVSAHRHAWTVTEATLTRELDEWLRDDPLCILRAANALNQSGILESAAFVARANACKMLVAAAREIRGALPVAGDDLQGLVTLEKWAAEHELPTIGLASISRTVADRLKSKPDDHEPADVFIIIREAYAAAGLSLEGAVVRLDMDPPKLVAALRHAHEDWDYEHAVALKPAKHALARVAQYLAQQVADGKATVPLMTVAHAVMEDAAFDATPLIIAAGERVQAENGVAKEEAATLIDFLLYSGESAAKHLERLATNGHLHHHIHTTNGDNAAQALVLAALMVGRPDMKLSTHAGNSNAGNNLLTATLEAADHGLAGEIARLLIDRGSPEVLLLAREQRPTPLTGLALAALAADEECIHLFTYSEVARHYSALSAYGAARDLLPLVADDVFVGGLTGAGFHLEDALLYKTVLDCRPEDSGLAEWLLEGLGTLDVNSWLGDLNSGEPVTVLLASAILQAGAAGHLAKDCRDGIRGHAEGVAAGEQAPADVAPLIQLLTGDQADMLADDLFRVWVAHSGAVVDEFYTGFGATLARAEELKRDTYQFVRCGAEAIAASQSAAGANWLADLLEQDISLYVDMPGSRKDAFRTALMSRWVEEPATDFGIQLERIRTLTRWHRKRPSKVVAGG